MENKKKRILKWAIGYTIDGGEKAKPEILAKLLLRREVIQ